MCPSPRIRTAARAIIMDAERRVLLVHFDFRDDDKPNGFWACPGGGVDPGESLADGLVRELKEEVGLTITNPGDPVWWKVHHFHFPMMHWDGQHDTYFFVQVDAFEPLPQFSVDELAAEGLDAIRWWTYDDLMAAQAAYDAGTSDRADLVVFSPRRLGHLVTDLIERGRPPQPVEVSAR